MRDPVGGVVLCCPLLSEFVRNYAREVALARALARRGVVVHRFHYRGTGRSDGDSSEVTFETMTSDAEAAARCLVEEGIDNISFFGTRVGAMVAAAASAPFEAAPVALWEPVTDLGRYFREVFRARLLHELKEGGNPGASDERLVAELRSRGTVDVVGWPIDLPLYDSLVRAHPGFARIASARPVLLVQLRRSTGLARDHAALVRHLEELGCACETASFFAQEAWWFAAAGRGERARLPVEQLVDTTATWLARRLAEGRPR